MRSWRDPTARDALREVARRPVHWTLVTLACALALVDLFGILVVLYAVTH